MIRTLLYCIMASSCLALNVNAQDINIIPQPVSTIPGTGHFTLTPASEIFATPDASQVADLLSATLRQSTGYSLRTGRYIKAKNHSISLITVKNFADTIKGAYSLDVTTSAIVAKAASKEGLFNAVQTIRQLFPPAAESSTVVSETRWTAPVVQIRDAPRFGWRGYMKDVSRTFYGMEVMKKYMDVMALYKINVLHLHLTDDQGWRIAIKKYPELTSPKTTVFEPRHNQPAERSGYYTQEQIRELVAYAAARNITIVPEIDVPGHCWPIIITHPELGVNKITQPDYVFPFNDSWGYWKHQFTPNPLDPTREDVYTFLDNVFTEVAALFPAQYIHFGGDEVVHRLWENEPHIKAFMAAKNMKKIEELQSYFVQRVCSIIVKKGKIPIGWNDILSDMGNLPKSATIMSWLGGGAVRQAAQNGFYTIATPTSPLYFDIQQKDRNDGTMADLNYSGPNTIEGVYNYDPARGLSDEEKKYLLGVQANMWPAVPQEVKDVNVQNFPRLLALAEIGWASEKKKDVAGFLKRVNAHYQRLDVLKIDYYRNGGYIAGTWNPTQLSTDYQTLTWDVTKKIYANGRVQAGFFYTEGESFLKVKQVQLLENGKVIATDSHESLADKFRGIPFKKNMFFYALRVDQYNPGAKYTLRAEVAGDKSNDSKGNVTLNLSPYKPFTVVETGK